MSPRWIGAVGLAAALAFVLYPVRAVIEGVGTIEPDFDRLVVVVPGASGMVTRVRASARQDVDQGTPLFEYIPEGQWAVKSYASASKPGVIDPPPSEPEWYRTVNERRLARAAALRHWSGQVLFPGRRPLAWERRLEQRLNTQIRGEDDLMREQARAAENARLGRDDANLVQVFDPVAGMIRGTEEGQPFSSETAGLLYSLWVTQRQQIYARVPVAEIMPPGCPLEVLGLVTVPPAAIRELTGWTAKVVTTETSLGVGRIDLGSVALAAKDAGLIVPHLAVTRDSVFVRLSLNDPPAREKLGAPVLITLTSPRRPRLWFWLRAS